MSIFAGIYSLREPSDKTVPDSASIDAIVRVISRTNDKVETYSDGRLFLAKVDVKAFPDRAFIIGANGTVATLAGFPLLNPSVDAVNLRSVDLEKISEELDHERINILRHCEGTFALCHYRLADGRLILAVDKVGVRPLYYHLNEESLIFSTSLRVLESLSSVPKHMDLQAAAEMASFGYPLRDRTPYIQIKTLLNGESLVSSGGAVQKAQYFRWDWIKSKEIKPEEFLDQVYREFTRAVACRSGFDQSAASMLSGGLDSRCIVTVLKHLGKDLSTVAYETPGYRDGIYANRYAEVICTKHICKRRPAALSWSTWSQCLKELEWPEGMQPKYPKLVFSGDGGSVGLGFVLIEEETFNWMHQNRADLAIQRLLQYRKLPRRFMRPKAFIKMHNGLNRNLEAEIGGIQCVDKGRSLHIFFLENDQRRHLYPFYEDIDEHRLEFLLPFYDSKFLELTVSAPAEIYLRHKFYHQWLEKFPKEFFSVPWQTYPGHLPCPVDDKSNARNQWETTRRDRFAGKSSELYNRCRSSLNHEWFPIEIMNRGRVALALLLHRLRLRDYTYVFETCMLFHDYYAKCKGEIASLPNDQ